MGESGRRERRGGGGDGYDNMPVMNLSDIFITSFSRGKLIVPLLFQPLCQRLWNGRCVWRVCRQPYRVLFLDGLAEIEHRGRP